MTESILSTLLKMIAQDIQTNMNNYEIDLFSQQT